MCVCIDVVYVCVWLGVVQGLGGSRKSYGDVEKVLTIISQDRTRNNGFKLEKCRFNKEIGKNWFTNRVVDDWNRLNQQVVNAKTIGSFKRRLEDFMDGDGRWV